MKREYELRGMEDTEKSSGKNKELGKGNICREKSRAFCRIKGLHSQIQETVNPKLDKDIVDVGNPNEPTQKLLELIS